SEHLRRGQEPHLAPEARGGGGQTRKGEGEGAGGGERDDGAAAGREGSHTRDGERQTREAPGQASKPKDGAGDRG
ncbi:hypothetical protein C3R44_24350, partial [Mycobacterium tuberculosis]